MLKGLYIVRRYEFPEMHRDDLQLVAELLATRQTLYQNLDLFISKILDCLDKKVVTFRVKAVRAIGQIASLAPGILDEVIHPLPALDRPL